LRVGPVAENDVDVVEAQPLERRVDRLHQVLAVEGVLRVGPVVDAPIELGRYHVGAAGPAEPAEGLAHKLFALAGRVRLGVVEEVDASLVGDLHALHAGLEIELVGERDPGAERQDAQLESGATHPSVFHLHRSTDPSLWSTSSWRGPRLSPNPP